MLNQLNYYSRYNRKKSQQKKPIQSLYSLLSINTLTKLANDATMSLQMINLYKKKQKYSYVNYISNDQKIHHHQNQQDNQPQYLQANLNKRYLQQYEGRVDNNSPRKIQLNLKKSLEKLQKSVESRKGSRINQKKSLISPQKQQRKKYLQDLVRQVRQKSRQRAQQQILNDKILQNKRKKQKKTLLTSRQKQSKKNKISNKFSSLNQSLVQQVTPGDIDSQFLQNKQIRQALLIVQRSLASPSKQFQQIKQKIQKRLSKSNLKHKINKQHQTNNQKIPNSPQASSKQKQCYKQNYQQYVESFDDQEQNQQNSRLSVVIARMSLEKGSKQKQNKAKMEDMIKQWLNKQNQKQIQSSKQDNPSSNQVKQDEIKSFSKEEVKVHKPSKNLIDLELMHSQSQKWEPLKERQLEILYDQRNFVVQENFNSIQTLQLTRLQFQNLNNHQSIILPEPLKKGQQSQRYKRSNPLSNRTFSKPDDQLKLQLQDKVADKIQQIDQNYPMSQSYKTINSIMPAQFLSQINNRRSIQDPPYQHPLQYISEEEKYMMQMQQKKKQIGIHNHAANKKSSFKKLIMMNRELNPRLVTSTILNEKNTNHRASRELLKSEQRENSMQSQKNKDLEDNSSLGKDQNKQQNSLSLPKNNNKQIPQKKKNFKQMMNKKAKQLKNSVPQNKDQIAQSIVSFKKRQNKKLLQAFFNAN